MEKKVRLIIMAAALLVFLGSGGAVLVIQGNYRASRQGYEAAAAEYTKKAESASAMSDSGGAGSGALEQAAAQPPIAVDFGGLQADNPQVVAWLYCEGTVIDYPVMRGEDNDFYLHHSYTGAEDQSGAIFMDAQCSSNFSDSNSIIYGHSMKDGSMFGGLEAWKDQAYYEEHPAMWLFTPDASYKVKLFSGYTTSAYSETYTIFRGPGDELAAYLEWCRSKSDFICGETSAEDGRYIVLSTCAYDFDEARYVLHGRLEQVDMH